LTKGYLKYFKPEKQMDGPINTIDFEDCSSVALSNVSFTVLSYSHSEKKKTGKKKKKKKKTKQFRNHCIELRVKNRTYYLQAKDEDEMYEWLAVFQKVLFFFRPPISS